MKEITGTTRYEQLMTAINTDEHFQREVMLGKRIGMYKFRGELGTGNFSRVSLGFHQLAHGIHFDITFTCRYIYYIHHQSIV